MAIVHTRGYCRRGCGRWESGSTLLGASGLLPRSVLPRVWHSPHPAQSKNMHYTRPSQAVSVMRDVCHRNLSAQGWIRRTQRCFILLHDLSRSQRAVMGSKQEKVWQWQLKAHIRGSDRDRGSAAGGVEWDVSGGETRVTGNKLKAGSGRPEGRQDIPDPADTLNGCARMTWMTWCSLFSP